MQTDSNKHNLDTLDKIIIPIILMGFIYIVALFIGIDQYLSDAMTNKVKFFLVFYLVLFLVTIVIIAVFVTNRYVKVPMEELTSFLDQLKNDKYETYKKTYKNQDIDRFILQVNKIIEYLDLKDQKSHSLIETLEYSNTSLSEYKKAVDVSAIIAKFDKMGVYKYVNDKFIDISQYSNNELIGKPYSHLKHHDIDQSFFDEITTTIESKETWNGIIKNITKDGSDYYLSTTIIPMLSSNEEIIEYLSVSFDITEHIHSLQKAKSAEASKSTFLATMSHEIRTPLNGILGFSKLLCESNLPKKEENYSNIINTSAQSLLGIINDILDISKIESGKLTLEHVEFNPFKEFEPVIELFVAKANEKNINILFFIDPSLPSTIVSDSLKIKQVMSNLIGNAIKFTPKNGHINIKIEVMDKQEESVKVLFSIKDTGVGVPIEKQKVIFDPFSQADDSVARTAGGTGLGLSISSNIIALMGSKIELNSKENLGSEFKFILDLDYIQTRNLYPQIDENMTIALFKKELQDHTQFNLIEKYLSYYSKPSIINHIEDINQYNLLIFTYNDFKQLDQNKFTTPSIIIHAEDEFVDVHTDLEYRTIKLPINQSKLYDAIVDICNKDIKEEIQVDQEAIKHSNSIALIVEDNPVNQYLLEVMLSQKGIRSKIVENGLLAVEEIKSQTQQYDIIFMDINMPIMNGIDATKNILVFEEEYTIQHTPIIALTANSVAGDREKFLKEGLDDYMSKPFEEKTLDEVLTKYIQTNDKESSSVHKKDESQLSLEQDSTCLEKDTFHYSIEGSAKALNLNTTIFKNILDAFFKSMEGDLISFKTSIKQNNITDISNVVHKMKGASSNLKMDTISTPLINIENAIRQNQPINYDEMYSTIVEEVTKIKKLYQEYYQ